MKRKANQLAVLIISVCLLLPGNAVYAGGKSEGTYHFSRNKSAVKQLNDLFTTIDIMDATIGDLTKEMEAGKVDTSDPYATYKAAKKLAKSYDSVIKALKKSGLKKR